MKIGNEDIRVCLYHFFLTGDVLIVQSISGPSSFINRVMPSPKRLLQQQIVILNGIVFTSNQALSKHSFRGSNL